MKKIVPLAQVPLDTKQRVPMVSFAKRAGKGVLTWDQVKGVTHVLTRQTRETRGPAEEMM